MIFRAEMLAKVLDGSKSETRRPVHANDMLSHYRPDKDYAVQPGRGKSAVARLYVTAVERAQLRDLTDEDARREGFTDGEDFARYWRELYGTFDPYTEVWVIRFTLLVPCVFCALPTHRRFHYRDAAVAACSTDHLEAWRAETEALGAIVRDPEDTR